jgi:hypothetical protein
MSDTQSSALRGEHTLTVFNDSVLKGTSGNKEEDGDSCMMRSLTIHTLYQLWWWNGLDMSYITKVCCCTCLFFAVTSPYPGHTAPFMSGLQHGHNFVLSTCRNCSLQYKICNIFRFLTILHILPNNQGFYCELVCTVFRHKGTIATCDAWIQTRSMSEKGKVTSDQ